MQIMRHQYESPEGTDFWFLDRDTADRMIARNGGRYLGFNEVPQSALPPTFRQQPAEGTL